MSNGWDLKRDSESTKRKKRRTLLHSVRHALTDLYLALEMKSCFLCWAPLSRLLLLITKTGDTRMLALWHSHRSVSILMTSKRLHLWSPLSSSTFFTLTPRSDMLPYIASVKWLMIWLKNSKRTSMSKYFLLWLRSLTTPFPECRLMLALQWLISSKELMRISLYNM